MKISGIKIFSSLLLQIFLFVSVYGQEPIVRIFLKNSVLGDEQINIAYQDQQGYLWIGTDAGLYKHDGTSIINSYTFTQKFKAGVSALFQDSKAVLWIGLQNGKILKQIPNYKPVFLESDSFPNSKITKIVESEDKRIWFGTYGDGIFYTEGKDLMRIDHEHAITDNYIYDIEKDAEGNLWLGTDNGINIIKSSKSGLQIEQLTVDNGLPDFIVQCIDRDKDGNMWIGMHENGVCKYDIFSKSFIVPKHIINWTFGPVNDILVLHDRLFIATDGKGVVSYGLDSGQSYTFIMSEEINITRIKNMIHDQEGNVWLVSHHEIGLSFGNRLELLKTINDYQISNVHALIASENGNIWFGNDQGLFCYDPMASDLLNQLKAYSIGLKLDHQKIMSLYIDPFGYIWVGTFGQGVIRLDPESGLYKRYAEQDGLANANILAIKGNDKAIWLATLGGASRFKIDQRFNPEVVFENFGKKEGLSNNYIYDIHIDQNGIVWFATDGSGVIYYKNGAFNALTQDIDFNNKVVYSVVSDMDGQLWMNVAHEGLYRYDGNSIEKFFDDPDHNSQSINGILPNNNDELVIAYDNGIEIINTSTGYNIQFEQNAWLSSINPDLNTLTKDADGNIWIGTAPFILKYNPADSSTWQFPNTRINKVELFLEEIDSKKQDQFTHDENHFSFNYSGLWYQFPDKVVYRIKLEGHDLGWMQTRDKRVIYSDLSPGKYTFRVVSGLHEGFSHGNEVTYSFKIKQPFWASFWFIALMVIILGSIVFTYIIIRERNIRRKQEIIRDRIMFQFESLKSQINPHFLFNSFSTLIALIETQPDKAIDYVTELSALFRNVLEYKDKDVIDLSEELTIAENYIQLQKKRYGENLVFERQIPDKLKKSKIPPLTLQLLFENALKHNVVSRDKPLKILISADLSKGYIFVKNNLQLKKEVLSSTGIGIETIVNRYRILANKEILIEKTEGSFTVGIPIMYT